MHCEARCTCAHTNMGYLILPQPPAWIRLLASCALKRSGLVRAIPGQSSRKLQPVNGVPLQISGGLAAMEAVTEHAVALSCSALLSGAAREALKSFFHSTQQGTSVLSHTTLRSRLLESGVAAPRAAQRSAAECVAALCKGSTDRVSETLRLCITTLEKQSAVRPSLNNPPCAPSARGQHQSCRGCQVSRLGAS